MNATPKPLMQVVHGDVPSRYPIWFLRQAGRYLPEYLKIRSELDFLELCRTPAKAMEVTLQPLKRFDLDAAIIFSDILVPPAHMGQSLRFDAGHGPVLTPVVRSAADLSALRLPDVEKELGYVGEAIALCKQKLNPAQTMIGFAGAPFTVASYMIEGGSSSNFSEVKKLLLQDPKTFHSLLDLLVEVTFSYLQMQVAAGADVVMLFDSWAGNLTSADYREHVLPSLHRLVGRLRAAGTAVIYFPGQGAHQLYELKGLDVQVIAADWRVPLGRAAKIMRDLQWERPLQGNLDPMVLSWGDEACVRAHVAAVLRDAAAAGLPGHIFNVGHGVLPTTKPEAIGWAIDEVRRAALPTSSTSAAEGS